MAEGGPDDPRPGPAPTRERPRRSSTPRWPSGTTPVEGVLLGLDAGVVVVDAQYDIVRINTAARRMLGIHGTAFEQDFIHLADVLPSSAVRTAIDAALKGKTGHAVHEVEAADVASDSTRHLETTMRPLMDEAGHVTAVVIELTDVTGSNAIASRTRGPASGWTRQRC